MKDADGERHGAGKPASAAPVTLVRLTGEQADRARRHGLRYADRPVDICGVAFAVRPCPPPAGWRGSGWKPWTGTLGGAAFTGWASADAVMAVARRAGLDLGPAPDDDLLVRAAEWLGACAAGDALRLDEPATIVDPPRGLGEAGTYAFCFPECDATVAIEVSPPLQRKLDDLLATWPQEEPRMDGLAARVACVLGQASLSLRDLAAVIPGDVIEIDGPPAAPGHVFLVAGGSLVAEAAPHGGGWRLVTGFSRPAGFSSRRTLIVNSPEDEADAGAPCDAGLSDLPVLLTFEVGRTELALSQLNQIGAGYVFDLGGDPDRVDIVSAGRRVGAGRIVEVEGRKAVQVERIVR
jgi:type III secretion system YscQ/HrcQ family protein